MLNVYLTIDVEVWSPHWRLEPAALQQAYDTYILGRTAKGDFGLPYQLDVMNSANLTAVCFVEPLFSKVAGQHYLADIIKLCQLGSNDIQLHAHPEWLKHGVSDFQQIDFSQRYLLSEFTLSEQRLIIAEAKRLLEQETNRPVAAFRAGSFSANANTLIALQQLGIAIDSSFNLSMPTDQHGFLYHSNQPNAIFLQQDVVEYPMTVYKTYNNSLRHAQLAACTFQELKALLEHALKTGQRDFVILSHSVEMLDGARKSVDKGTLDTFLRTVEFLQRQPDKYACQSFSATAQPLLQSQELTKLHAGYTLHRTLSKVIHQLSSKF